jgi:hypothetical protein
MNTGNNNVSVDHPVEKTIALWGLIGVSSWADFAALVASVYSVLLIGEWLWKKFLRDWAIAHGLARPLNRRRSDK